MCHDKLKAQATPREDSDWLVPKIEAEWRTNRAAALINYSVACMGSGEMDTARGALDEAFALTSENSGLTGLVRVNFAKLALCGDDTDQALFHLDEAVLQARKAGRPDVLRAALHIRAQLFTWRSEYDHAVEDLTMIETLLSTTGLDPLSWVRMMQLRGEIASLQGKPEMAYECFSASLEKHPALRQSPAVTDLHVRLIALCASYVPLRGKLLNDVCQLLTHPTEIRRRAQLLTLKRQLESVGSSNGP